MYFDYIIIGIFKSFSLVSNYFIRESRLFYDSLILLICCVPVLSGICSCNNWTSLVACHLGWFNTTDIYHLLVCAILGGQWIRIDWSQLSGNNLTISLCLLLQCDWLVNDVLCLLGSYSRGNSHVFLRFFLHFIFYIFSNKWWLLTWAMVSILCIA